MGASRKARCTAGSNIGVVTTAQPAPTATAVNKARAAQAALSAPPRKGERADESDDISHSSGGRYDTSGTVPAPANLSYRRSPDGSLPPSWFARPPPRPVSPAGGAFLPAPSGVRGFQIPSGVAAD